ncbi:MAG: galactose mutarotase [Alphaproteobacteria bacterium]|nr:galactose mutarotase [Alphaproteobacteria bacterium]
MNVTRRRFGTWYNQPVDEIVLENDSGMSASILELGGCLRGLVVPDDKGAPADVVLGLPTVADYVRDRHYFGAIVGRVANRISGAKFELDGQNIAVDANAHEGRHCVHGGRFGYHRRVWTTLALEQNAEAASVVLGLEDGDGEEGFVHRVSVRARYSLSNDNNLSLVLEAEADGPTPINITAHGYFNLIGEGTATIAGHALELASPLLLEQGADRIPNGTIADVTDTPFDFTRERVLDDVVAEGMEINHSYVFDAVAGAPLDKIRKRATITGGGRRLDLWSNETTLHVYNGHNLDGVAGKSGHTYRRFAGLCLEPMGYVNGINEKAFPCCVIAPGKPYRHEIVYKFGPA